MVLKSFASYTDKVGYQTDCLHFSGYKPCGLSSDCSSRCPHKKRAGTRVLVIHLEALGAVLRATVLLQPILRRWPDAHITWITSSRAAALLENNPYIHRLLKNDHNGTLALSTLSFDYAFCIDKSLTAAGLLKVPQQIKSAFGFSSSETGVVTPLTYDAQELYDIGLSNVKKFFINTKPETQLLTEAMGLRFERDTYVYQFTQDEKYFQKAEETRLGLKDKSLIVGLNTGCSGVIPYKKLTVATWIDVCQRLVDLKSDVTILLLGGPEDTKRNQEIWDGLSEALKSNVIMTPTENGLRSGFIYMNMCHSVLTGDSLGLHMAIALKKWTVSWFGPTCGHEIDFYDRGEAVLTAADCAPCWKRHCDKARMCYDQVDIQKFVNLAMKPERKRQQLEVQGETNVQFERGL